MPRKSAANDVKAIKDDIVKIQRLIGDLQSQLGEVARDGSNTAVSQLSEAASSAATKLSENIADMWSDVSTRLRDGARDMSDDAMEAGSVALRRIEAEVENRPLMTLAIAAGIGFLAGMAGRRH